MVCYFKKPGRKEHMILCFVNYIKYMDRFVLAGVLTNVKNEFQIGDDKAGFLLTVFIIAYMLFAPIFGYMGDRHSRKGVMVFGVAAWSTFTYLGSCVSSYSLFAFLRGMVGVGEAAYSTVAPTIISDLFVGNLRSKMLSVFYFAIPVGSGMGYIVGSKVGAMANDWRWGLRVTPFLGIAAVILLLCVMKVPPRGQAEDNRIQATSYMEDLKSLARNRSFMLTNGGFTCVSFVTGALAWWGPTFVALGVAQQSSSDMAFETVSLIFGVLTMVSGVVGVPLGTWLGMKLVTRCPRAHPIICASGLAISAPFLTLAIIFCEFNLYYTFLFVFLGEVALNLNWSLMADMLLYVVIPPRRSSAEAFQIFVSHALGDAGSPYLVGVISEVMKASLNPDPNQAPSPTIQFKCLQYGLYITCFVEALGAMFLSLTAIYILDDKKQVEEAVAQAAAASAAAHHVVAKDVPQQKKVSSP